MRVRQDEHIGLGCLTLKKFGYLDQRPIELLSDETKGRGKVFPPKPKHPPFPAQNLDTATNPTLLTLTPKPHLSSPSLSHRSNQPRESERVREKSNAWAVVAASRVGATTGTIATLAEKTQGSRGQQEKGRTQLQISPVNPKVGSTSLDWGG